jgi:hypothetical protein
MLFTKLRYSPNTVIVRLSSLRFFYIHVLKRNWSIADGYVAPQLHTHAVVFNVTERDNGQSRAIQPQSLFASQQFATAIYQSELTYRLRNLGYEITVEDHFVLWTSEDSDAAREKPRYVGERGLLYDPPWIEFANKRRTRFEFESLNEGYGLIIPLKKVRCLTLDCS